MRDAFKKLAGGSLLYLGLCGAFAGTAVSEAEAQIAPYLAIDSVRRAQEHNDKRAAARQAVLDDVRTAVADPGKGPPDVKRAFGHRSYLPPVNCGGPTCMHSVLDPEDADHLQQARQEILGDPARTPTPEQIDMIIDRMHELDWQKREWKYWAGGGLAGVGAIGLLLWSALRMDGV